MRLALWLACVACVACVACSREPEYSGIGRWRFTRSTLGDATDGICQPTDLNDGRKGTWCFAQTPIRIEKRSAEVKADYEARSAKLEQARKLTKDALRP